MSAFFRKLAWLAKRHAREDQLDVELQFHLAEELEELRERGLAEADARQAARRELGNLTALREETRAAWGWTPLEHVVQDLRYAARTIRRNPAFAILAVLTLV
jgi:hypothetical protein